MFHYGLVDVDSPPMHVGSTATEGSPPDVNSVENIMSNPPSEFSSHCYIDRDTCTDADSYLETESSSEFPQHALTEPSSECEFSKHLSTEPSSEFSSI